MLQVRSGVSKAGVLALIKSLSEKTFALFKLELLVHICNCLYHSLSLSLALCWAVHFSYKMILVIARAGNFWYANSLQSVASKHCRTAPPPLFPHCPAHGCSYWKLEGNCIFMFLEVFAALRKLETFFPFAFVAVVEICFQFKVGKFVLPESY